MPFSVYIPEFGEVTFTAQNAYVAKLNSSNAYVTPKEIQYFQDFDYDPQTDNDTLKAQGANRELLTVTIGGESELEEASLSLAAINLMTGDTEVESGTSGNRRRTTDSQGAGRGFPYIGQLIVAKATIGSAVFGFAKGMLRNYPGGSMAQNTFRTGTLNFDWVVLPSTNKWMRMRKYESDSDIPDFSDASAWDTFFGASDGMTSIFTGS